MRTDLDKKIEILNTYIEDAKVTCLEILQERAFKEDYKETFVTSLYEIPTLLYHIQKKLNA